MQWTKESTCNSKKPNFDAIEFSTNNSRIELCALSLYSRIELVCHLLVANKY